MFSVFRFTDELKATAVELRDLVQQKVGTTKFSVTYNKIRQTVLGVQRERRTARVTKACFGIIEFSWWQDT